MYETVAVSDIIQSSLLALWQNVAGFLPRLVGALAVFFVGWLIAALLGRLVKHLVKLLHVDRGLESVGFRSIWERSGFKLNSALFFAELVKWFFIVVFLLAAADILGLTQVAEFLRSVVLYIPNVIVAAIVMIIGLLVAGFLGSLVRGSAKAAGLLSANTLAELTHWAVVVFSLLIALTQLNVADEVVRIVIIGIIAASAIAVGLAFGLGGRSHADDLISKLKKRLAE